MCLATTLLRLGRFAEGWQEYEWRWKSAAKQFHRPPRPQPPWGGEPLNGRTLLVESEQGLGDILQFVAMSNYCTSVANASYFNARRP